MFVTTCRALFAVVIVSILACVAAADPARPTRQIPGQEERPTQFPPFIFESVPDINSSASEFVPVPDRWRQLYAGKWYDPYNQNVLKGDIPVFGSPGHEWFFNTEIISETGFESLRLPIPVGGQSTETEGRTDTFGGGRIKATAETLFTSFSLLKGNTTFKPPDFEFRFAPAFNLNHVEAEETGVLRIDPAKGSKRDDGYIGIQELFVDYHLANITERYDFISSRVGIQPFQSDFRGFIYNDSQPGARIFGNFDNNKLQYNAAWFSRLDKDTNSGLNTVFDNRHEQVAVLNAYRQDAPVLGHTLSASIIYRADTAGSHGDHYDDNGVLRRPAVIGDSRSKNLYTTYFGLTGDGHFDRINSTSAFYYVTGSETHNQIAQRSQDISAAMVAQEISYDVDWMRFRASVFWASGDDDPFDDEANGFDAIFDNPNFAGGDLAFWQRQGIPLIGGGEVLLTNPGSLLANFRSSKGEGQSNFVNPGVRLFNLGADFELMPTLKLITNASFLQFDEVASLKAVRQDGSFDRNIGYDFSAGLLYRPFLNNNVQFRFGASTLIPDTGLKNLYIDNELYSLFTNMTLMY